MTEGVAVKKQEIQPEWGDNGGCSRKTCKSQSHVTLTLPLNVHDSYPADFGSAVRDMNTADNSAQPLKANFTINKPSTSSVELARSLYWWNEGHLFLQVCILEHFAL